MANHNVAITATKVTWRATTVRDDHTIGVAFKDAEGRPIILAMPPLEALKLASSITDVAGGFFDEELQQHRQKASA